MARCEPPGLSVCLVVTTTRAGSLSSCQDKIINLNELGTDIECERF